MTDNPERAPSIVLTIAGTPHPQPRPRFVGKGRVVSTATKGAKLWREAVTRAARTAIENLGGGLDPRNAVSGCEVEIGFAFPTPDASRHGKPHTHKPDVDNLAKLVLDVLVEVGILGVDDAAVARLGVWKGWAARGGAAVVVRPLGGQILGHSVDVLGGGTPPGWLGGGQNAVSGRGSHPAGGVVPDVPEPAGTQVP